MWLLSPIRRQSGFWKSVPSHAQPVNLSDDFCINIIDIIINLLVDTILIDIFITTVVIVVLFLLGDCKLLLAC